MSNTSDDRQINAKRYKIGIKMTFFDRILSRSNSSGYMVDWHVTDPVRD